MRDGLKIIKSVAGTQSLVQSADPPIRRRLWWQMMVIMPALTDLGAPHWKAEYCGVIVGDTRNTDPAELTRAALENVGLRTRYVLLGDKGGLAGRQGHTVG